MNLYAYVNNDPTNYVDPFGMEMECNDDGTQCTTTQNRDEIVNDFNNQPRDVTVSIGDGFHHFFRNWQDMRSTPQRDDDKYFHCKANCEVTQRGDGGEEVAEDLSDFKEWTDMYLRFRDRKDSERDQEANRFGREGAKKFPGKTCKEICSPHRPKHLEERY